jgi:hypothetical protein
MLDHKYIMVPYLYYTIIEVKSERTKKNLVKIKGERRDLNPRMMESQSIALPLGYARLVMYLYHNN